MTTKTSLDIAYKVLKESKLPMNKGTVLSLYKSKPSNATQKQSAATLNDLENKQLCRKTETKWSLALIFSRGVHPTCLKKLQSGQC